MSIRRHKKTAIICLALDDDENIRYRNPLESGKYIRSLTADESKEYYVFLDEMQKVVTMQNPYIENVEDKISFVDVVPGLMRAFGGTYNIFLHYRKRSFL